MGKCVVVLTDECAVCVCVCVVQAGHVASAGDINTALITTLLFAYQPTTSAELPVSEPLLPPIFISDKQQVTNANVEKKIKKEPYDKMLFQRALESQHESA